MWPVQDKEELIRAQQLGFNWPIDWRRVFLGNLPTNVNIAMILQVLGQIPGLSIEDMHICKKKKEDHDKNGCAIVVLHNPAWHVMTIVMELHGHVFAP